MFSLRHFPPERCLEILSEMNEEMYKRPFIGYHVPMKTEEELSIWRSFKDYDKGNPIACDIIYTGDGIKQLVDINVDHPLVILLAKFAVDNLSELCLRADVSNGLDLVRVVKASYLSRFTIYLHELILEVKEHGLGEHAGIRIYKMKVETRRDDGTMTLINAMHYTLSSVDMVLRGEDLARYLEERSLSTGKEKINEQSFSCEPSRKRKRKRGKKKSKEARHEVPGKKKTKEAPVCIAKIKKWNNRQWRRRRVPDSEFVKREFNLYESDEGCYHYQNPLPGYVNYRY